MLAAADYVLLIIEEGAQGGAHDLGFGFIAPARDLFQTVIHGGRDLHRQTTGIFNSTWFHTASTALHSGRKTG
jgi:hypothetical protein